jgi:phage baseplate assembly protein W
MIGMSRTTGKPLEGLAHLRQSIADILTTPLGSRVMRRDYGSLLSTLIDQPFNGATRVRLYAATAQALMRWEPRLRVRRVGIDRDDTGAVTVTVDGTLVDGAQPSAFDTLTLPLTLQAA